MNNNFIFPIYIKIMTNLPDNVRNLLLYTVLAIVLLYVLKKLYEYMNENFVQLDNFDMKDGIHITDDIAQRNNARCPVYDTDADTYIRQRLLAGVCKDNKTMTKKQLQDYSDKHFAFKNKVWQTSRDVDMVDKINYMYLAGNEDYTRNNKGERISDLFNSLTNNNDMQNCSLSSDKTIERIANEVGTKVEGHNGNMFSDAKWEYNDEKLMNGGAFYGDIHPYSGQCNLQQTV